MSDQIVALSIDKIQTFLTEIIHSHVQEKQTEDATLRGIINSSYQISKGFFKVIHNTFSDTDMLLECSGVCVFRCALPEQELEGRLNTLFRDYYKESQGQKLIRWTYFSSEGLDNIAAIQKAKKRLKQSRNWNDIIIKNQDLLFSFCKVQGNKNKKNSITEELKEFKKFARDINALYRKEEGEQDKECFRIAILKADLDGMGAMFEKISDYNDYSNISQILNEEISLTGLHEAAAKYAPIGKTAWLFPLYIAGDDIFFAVAVEDLICGIKVCRKIIQTVNERIQDKGSLTMSIGVEITFNKQPVRYYMGMVEEQLKNAKSSKIPESLKPFLVMKISIRNLTFFDISYKEIKKQKKLLQNVPVWDFFLSDVKILNYIRSSESGCSELLGKPNFFYTLLEDITSKEIQCDPIKYSNHVFYHLIPNYLEDSNQQIRKMELLLNNSLISQLYKKDEKGTRMVLNKDTKHRFETYLRLMLLFCDVRFHISAKEGWEKYEKRYGQNKKEIYRHLFGQPREYLYESSLKNESSLKKINESLRDVFVQKINRRELHKEGYQCLALETSMFFRLRKVESIPIEKAAKMIEIRNPSTEKKKQEIEERNKEREEKGKLPNRLYFNKNDFFKNAKKKNAWSSDFVDSLMLFYQYNEMVMKFNKIDKDSPTSIGRERNGQKQS